jgi:hypothetical protein
MPNQLVRTHVTEPVLWNAATRQRRPAAIVACRGSAVGLSFAAFTPQGVAAALIHRKCAASSHCQPRQLFVFTRNFSAEPFSIRLELL